MANELSNKDSANLFSPLLQDKIYLLFVLIVALLIRLHFLLDPGFALDSDEAIVGLMAKHMLEGKGIPVFYYGQHYMGSLEAICAAGSFALFGISTFALQLVPFVFGLFLIPVIYLMGIELGSKWAGRIGALYIALPPVGLVVWSLKARGGFIELVFIGSLALLLFMKWLKNPKLDRTAVVGMLLGVGWWVNNQIIYYMLPIALFAVATVLYGPLKELPRRIVQGLSHLGVGLLSFILGGLAFWLYNLENGFPSFGMFGFATWKEVCKHFAGLWSTAIPILLGAKRFWAEDPLLPGETAITYSFYAFLLFTLMWSRRSEVAALFRLKVDKTKPVEILIVFIIASCAVFVVSTFGWLVQAPRYLLPIYSALGLIVGLGIEQVTKRLGRPLGFFCLAAILSINLLSSYLISRFFASYSYFLNMF